MSKEAVFSYDDTAKNCREESPIDIEDLNQKVVDLIRENDKQKQEIYDLQRKLEVQEKFNEELAEDGELSSKLLKSDHEKKIKELIDMLVFIDVIN